MTAAHFTEVLFIGYFTAAGVYSTLIFLITRNRPFLYYAALMDAAALAQLVFAGDLLGMAPGSERLLLFRLGSYTLFGIAQAAAALAFFAAWPVAPSYRRTVYAVLGLNLLLLAAQAALPADVPLQMAGHGLFLGLLLVCGACGRKQAKEGNESARFYVAGYAAAALGIVLSTLAHVLGWGNWPEYFFQIGITWQGALLALGLAGNYAKLDPLTGVKSRRSFDAHLTSAWKSAVAHSGGLAVILVAAHGLKAYEAQYGRVASDILLRRIANMCSGCCRSKADVFARYGDEAFAAIIPRVTRAQANDIGARMRESVARDCLLPVGVGISSIENAISQEALLQQAARRAARDAIARAGLALAER